MRKRLALAALGLAQGVVIWLLQRSWPEEPQAIAYFSATLAFVAVSGLIYHFAESGAARGRLIAVSAVMGLAFASTTFWVTCQLPGENATFEGDDYRVGTWVVGTLIALYILGPFIQIYQASGRFRFPYVELFKHSWNNFFIAAVAGLFALVYWLLVVLWAELFDLIGIEFFEDIFYEEAFAFPTLGAALGFGIAIGRESERVIGTLRRITLAVFHALMPMLVVILLLFLIALPFTGLQALWDTGNATTLLLSLLIAVILFINAVFQDGEGAPPYPTWLRRVVEIAIVGSPIIAGLAAYGIALRVGQHGVSPDRFYVVLFVSILGAYALAYSAAVLNRRGPWLHWLRPFNVAIALVVAALALLTHTPLLDPIAWSVRSQVDRLLSHDVAPSEFDFGFLKFELGRKGAAALEQLATHERAEEFSSYFEWLRTATGYWDWKQMAKKGDPYVLELRVFPAGEDLSELDGRGMLSHVSDWEWEECKRTRDCAALWINLDQDPEDELVFLGGSQYRRLRLFDRDAEGLWHMVSDLGGSGEAQALVSALQEGHFGPEPPLYQDLRIGSEVFRLVNPFNE